MCRSIDRYAIAPGGQATYHNGHKIAFSLWPKWIKTVECGILTIKETSVKTLQIRLYSVIFNLSIKNMYNKKKKKFDWKKNSTPSSQLFFNCNIEKAKITIFYVNFLFLEIISILVNVMYFWFILFVNTCHYHKLIRVTHEENKASTKLDHDRNVSPVRNTAVVS